MNRIVLLGNNVKDPEVRHTQNDNVYATFTIAVARRFDRDKTDFINCIAWNKTAEIIAQYVKKGDKIAVSGRLQIDKNETDDGSVRYFTNVVVDEITFLTSKKEEKDGEEIDFSQLEDL